MKKILLCAGIVFVAASVPAMTGGQASSTAPAAPPPGRANANHQAYLEQYCLSGL